MTYDPLRHERTIESFRDRLGYSRQFEYKKTDRLKLGLAKAVVDYFIECGDLEFQALVIDSAKYDLRFYSKSFDASGRSAELISYNYRYKQIIANNTSIKDELVVVLDSRATAKVDNLPVYLQREIANIQNV